MSMPLAAAEGKPAIIELRRFQLRNTTDAMSRRTQDFLEKAYVPALKRSGATVVGAFNSVIAMESPFILLVSSFPDLAAWDTATAKVQSDSDTAKLRDEFYTGPLQYVREEVSLLRGFPGFPAVQVPAAKQGGSSHVFELRRYESNTPRSLARKIRMFDEGEHARSPNSEC